MEKEVLSGEFRAGDLVQVKDEELRIMMNAGMRFPTTRGKVAEIVEEKIILDENDNYITHQLMIVEMEGVQDENGVVRSNLLFYSDELIKIKS